MAQKVYERAITNWPKEDRPRENLLKHGAHTLSNAEILAILIRTGVEGASVVELGCELLCRFKTLRALSACDPAELREIKGLSPAKIAQIKAGVELGRRMMSEERALDGPIGGVHLDGYRGAEDVLIFNHLQHGGVVMDYGFIDDLHAQIGGKVGARFFIIAR